jgi:hypothetical protein
MADGRMTRLEDRRSLLIIAAPHARAARICCEQLAGKIPGLIDPAGRAATRETIKMNLGGSREPS